MADSSSLSLQEWIKQYEMSKGSFFLLAVLIELILIFC